MKNKYGLSDLENKVKTTKFNKGALMFSTRMTLQNMNTIQLFFHDIATVKLNVINNEGLCDLENKVNVTNIKWSFGNPHVDLDTEYE